LQTAVDALRLKKIIKYYENGTNKSEVTVKTKKKGSWGEREIFFNLFCV